MTIEGIIRMAKQAGFADEEIDTCQQIFIHFAKLVAEHEREACANTAGLALLGADKTLSDRVLKAIRARGQG